MGSMRYIIMTRQMMGEKSKSTLKIFLKGIINGSEMVFMAQRTLFLLTLMATLEKRIKFDIKRKMSTK